MRHPPQHSLRLDAHALSQTGGQSPGLPQLAELGDGLPCRGVIVAEGHPQHLPSQSGEPSRIGLADVPCPVTPHGGEAGAVGNVEHGADRVSQLVDGKVLATSQTGQVVVGQAAAPHQLAPRLVVVRLFQCLGGVDHHRPQDGFRDAVGDLVGTGVDAKIALHGVQHHIRRPAGGLIGGEGVGQRGVQDGKGGTVEGGVAAPLAVGGFVGQDRRVAGLAARRGDGEHAAHGQSAGDGAQLAKVVPDGAAAGQTDGHRLAGVQHTGAAHPQKKVNALAGIGVRQLLGFGQTGIGLDADLYTVGDFLPV